MKNWFRRVRAALAMGLTWAVGWGVIGGTVMEGIVDRDGRFLDMWPQALAIPGFLLGVLFSIVLLLAERRRRFDDLSLPRFAALGAVAGAVLGGLTLAAGVFPGVTPLLRAAFVIGPLAVLSAASAAGTLVLARRGSKRALPNHDAAVG